MISDNIRVNTNLASVIIVDGFKVNPQKLFKLPRGLVNGTK